MGGGAQVAKRLFSQRVQSAGSSVSRQLLVPMLSLVSGKPRPQNCKLLGRKLRDGGYYFLNGSEHGGAIRRLSSKMRQVNAGVFWLIGSVGQGQVLQSELSPGFAGFFGRLG